MFSSTWETHIPSDMRCPTWETHIPSDKCSPTHVIHIPSDNFLLPGKHLSPVVCVPYLGNKYP